MENRHKIYDYCRIFKSESSLNGNTIFKSKISHFKDFAKQLYSLLEVDYPKFHKMDNLSKLAFLATEILSKNNPVEKSTALILSNSSSSMDSDVKHHKSISFTLEYHPSPAVFVYTLPNICLGEICIRNGLHTENSFFIFDAFRPEFLVPYCEALLDEGVSESIICGWVEIFGDHYDAFVYRVGKTGNIPHTIEQLHNLYNQWNH